MRYLLALIAALVALPMVASQALAQDYRLQRGDTVQIEVLEDGNLNRSALVLPDGQISLPMVGNVRAAGRTLEQIRTDITDKLAPGFATPPTVYVTLAALNVPIDRPERTIDIFVMGAANAPGACRSRRAPPCCRRLPRRAACRPSPPKSACNCAALTRRVREKIYRIDFAAIEAGTSNQGTTRVSDGDVIVVPERRLFE